MRDQMPSVADLGIEKKISGLAQQVGVSVRHYWTAKAIAARLGYRNVKSFYKAHRDGRALAFRRRDPRDSRWVAWYSNSQLILLSELAQVQRQLEEWKARQEEKRAVRVATQDGIRQGKRMVR